MGPIVFTHVLSPDAATDSLLITRRCCRYPPLLDPIPEASPRPSEDVRQVQVQQALPPLPPPAVLPHPLLKCGAGDVGAKYNSKEDMGTQPASQPRAPVARDGKTGIKDGDGVKGVRFLREKEEEGGVASSPSSLVLSSVEQNADALV
jgi:hypothetical protein